MTLQIRSSYKATIKFALNNCWPWLWGWGWGWSVSSAPRGVTWPPTPETGRSFYGLKTVCRMLQRLTTCKNSRADFGIIRIGSLSPSCQMSSSLTTETMACRQCDYCNCQSAQKWKMFPIEIEQRATFVLRLDDLIIQISWETRWFECHDDDEKLSESIKPLRLCRANRRQTGHSNVLSCTLPYTFTAGFPSL